MLARPTDVRFAPARSPAGTSDQTVIDLSCGSGLMARRLAKSRRFGRVIAVDFSENMLKVDRMPAAGRRVARPGVWGSGQSWREKESEREREREKEREREREREREKGRDRERETEEGGRERQGEKDREGMGGGGVLEEYAQPSELNPIECRDPSQ